MVVPGRPDVRFERFAPRRDSQPTSPGVRVSGLLVTFSSAGPKTPVPLHGYLIWITYYLGQGGSTMGYLESGT